MIIKGGRVLDSVKLFACIIWLQWNNILIETFRLVMESRAERESGS